MERVCHLGAAARVAHRLLELGLDERSVAAEIDPAEEIALK